MLFQAAFPSAIFKITNLKADWCSWELEKNVVPSTPDVRRNLLVDRRGVGRLEHRLGKFGDGQLRYRASAGRAK